MTLLRRAILGLVRFFGIAARPQDLPMNDGVEIGLSRAGLQHQSECATIGLRVVLIGDLWGHSC